ncbi:MAG TPA: beta-N-acetylhexosaminidase [Gammaproteobacteria bacterium]|nr:beta-N-acetylhexosaminidase [Gammaproteobacteria bacterium]
MATGPVMLDIEGESLSTEDRALLAHPQVGGVILFARNYRDPAQLRALVTDIHAVKRPPLIVAVDQEGGRVQRFRTGFTRMPPMRWLGERWDADAAPTLALATDAGWLLASELRHCGVDLSFAPVLDLDHGACAVIGDRAFHHHPRAVTELARAFMRGMLMAGMAPVGKHFPGHGAVQGDSHHELPVDPRSLGEIANTDLIPFQRLARHGLAGVMPAHVLYPAVDDLPAGFSPRWIQGILRGELGFEGAVFSDDLSMAGAHAAGTPSERAEAALAAGCDMLIVCNDRAAALEVIDGLGERPPAPLSIARLIRMHGRAHDMATALGSEASTARAEAIRARLAEWPGQGGGPSCA